MKAIGFYKPLPIADEQALTDIDLPVPELRPRDILVKVEAVSVNPVDTKVRSSATPPEGTARILGFDAAGTVEAVGAEVTLFKKGDEVFFYHSNEGLEIVGIAKVTKEAFPDPTADSAPWLAVELKPVKRLKKPVTLEQIKKEKKLADMALIRISRLSVQPVKAEEWDLILLLSGAK